MESQAVGARSATQQNCGISRRQALTPIENYWEVPFLRARWGRGYIVTEPVDRRQAIKSIVVVVGGAATTLMLPSKWTRPVVDAVLISDAKAFSSTSSQ